MPEAKQLEMAPALEHVTHDFPSTERKSPGRDIGHSSEGCHCSGERGSGSPALTPPASLLRRQLSCLSKALSVSEGASCGCSSACSQQWKLRLRGSAGPDPDALRPCSPALIFFNCSPRSLLGSVTLVSQQPVGSCKMRG